MKAGNKVQVILIEIIDTLLLREGSEETVLTYGQFFAMSCS